MCKVKTSHLHILKTKKKLKTLPKLEKKKVKKV